MICIDIYIFQKRNKRDEKSRHIRNIKKKEIAKKRKQNKKKYLIICQILHLYVVLIDKVTKSKRKYC